MALATERCVLALAMLIAPAACSRQPGADTAVRADPANAATTMPDLPQDSGDPARFAPLRSAAVKDAIHRALRSGRTERWQDGSLSGYAVPSAQTDRNGCRAVRYTVDQRAAATYETINACDATPAEGPR